MLVGTQRLELAAAIFTAFPTLGDFDLMLLTQVNQRRTRITAGIGLGVQAIIAEVVRAAEEEHWTKNLIAGVVASAGANPQIRGFLEKYPDLDPGAAAAAPVDHFESTFLVGRRVFLCRPDLRKQLRRLGQGTNTRVLIVTGPRGAGKTYSKDFLGYLLQFEPAYEGLRHKVADVNLDQAGQDLERLALRLGAEFGLPAASLPARPKEDKEQDSRWLDDLFIWLKGGVESGAADVWWLVLDGFRALTLPPAGFELINMLAGYADTQTTRLRVILINYPHGDAALPWSEVETITDPTLPRSAVEAFVRDIYLASGKDATDALVQQAVDKILVQVDAEVAKDPTQPHRHLALLSLALSRAAKQLLA